MTTIILSSLIIVAVVVAIFYFAAIGPARIAERWIAALANGEKFPEKPDVGMCYWLYPIHRELQGVANKMERIRAGSDEMQAKLVQVEFMQNYILASLIEGVMVVDENYEITLVNSEFLNLFQLTQSPLRQKVKEVLEDDKLEAMIRAAFKTGQVEAGRITKQFDSSPQGGRPPAFEVSAIPVRVSETRVGAVVVLFLPPPDRTRVVQTLKRHSEKLHRLVSEWTLSGRTRLRSSVSELADMDIHDPAAARSKDAVRGESPDQSAMMERTGKA
jgi:PAS domain-containing protein